MNTHVHRITWISWCSTPSDDQRRSKKTQSTVHRGADSCPRDEYLTRNWPDWPMSFPSGVPSSPELVRKSCFQKRPLGSVHWKVVIGKWSLKSDHWKGVIEKWSLESGLLKSFRWEVRALWKAVVQKCEKWSLCSYLECSCKRHCQEVVVDKYLLRSARWKVLTEKWSFSCGRCVVVV